jgi:excinuclease ABC subunit A
LSSDEQMMRSADWLRHGPGAGGTAAVVAEGTAARCSGRGGRHGQFLSGARAIAVPERRSEDLGSFAVHASQHNLKGIDVGSRREVRLRHGRVRFRRKSTLVNEIVYKECANRLHKMRTKPGDHESGRGSTPSTR